MKVYVVTEEYENDLDYEDYDRGGEYHCVCSTFDKAVEAIENIIKPGKENTGCDDYESYILPEDERECYINDGNQTWSIAKEFFTHIGRYDVTYYITETELI